MAQKKNTSSKTNASNVTRIKASSDVEATKTNTKSPSKASVAASDTTPQKDKKTPSVKGAGRPFVAIGSYFSGAWYELKQVRWPTRRATWSLTFAVLVYTAFFVVLVILLDVAFKYLFDIILGK